MGGGEASEANFNTGVGVLQNEHTDSHACMHTLSYICMYLLINVHTPMHARTLVHMHVFADKCSYTNACTHTHVCMHVQEYIYSFTS